jgi:hypothetical protein
MKDFWKDEPVLFVLCALALAWLLIAFPYLLTV